MTATPTDPTPEKDWKSVFVDHLSDTCNVSAAARAAGIHRDTAYAHRKADPTFAAGWDSALEIATDALEAEVRRRALKGTVKPIYQGGKRVGKVREYSDTLAIFLLKAHRPDRFRERVSQEHTGAVEVTVRYVDVDRSDSADAPPGPAYGTEE